MVKANKKECHSSGFCGFFQLLKPIFAKFPKKLQVGHNETRTVERLGHFGQENHKNFPISMEIFFSQVKPENRVFLAVFAVFGYFWDIWAPPNWAE
jgi:hypothetical protein